MTILSADLKLFAAEYPLDTSYGGGRMTATVVQDGTENNLFPDIDAAARSAGRVQMRKVFAAVVSANTDTLMGAGVSFVEPPSDSAVQVVAFAFGDQRTTQRDLSDYAAAYRRAALGSVVPGISFSTTINPPFLTIQGDADALSVGDTYRFTGIRNERLYYGYSVERDVQVLAVSGPDGSGLYTYAVDQNLYTYWTTPKLREIVPNTPAFALCGVKLSTAISGADSITVGTDVTVVDPLVQLPTPIFRTGDTVVLRDGATTETALIESITEGVLTFTAALANSYPIGSVVSTLLGIGDLLGSIDTLFSQQAWTRTFSDTLIGNTISANYNRITGAITTSNLGAATDRWAIVFTSSTAFKLISEQRGQIAAGDIGADFSPLNPLTSTPYFTIDSAGWGGGWATGNVLRFNTTGANAPLWVARTVSPSAPGSVDGATLEFRGTVDA